jgi:RNA polymerase sigma-70 factor (ECF subfamily)
LSIPSLPGRGGFDALYEANHPGLWRYVQRLVGDGDVADDIVQEAFVRLLKRPDLDGEAARLWLFTVATNLVRDRGRTSARRLRLLTIDPVAPEPDEPADQRLERRERTAAVRRALDSLSERDQQLLLMREEGFKYHEIAVAIGVAPGSIGTLIARAVKRFTETYEPLDR